MTTLKCPGAYLFLLVQFEDPVLKKIIKILLLFVYISGLECIFFDSLSDFYANIFFMHIVFCKQIILSFQALQTYFFNISHLRLLQKNNGPSLSTY